MKQLRVSLTRRQWESIRDPGSTQLEPWRWIESEDLQTAIASLDPRFQEPLRLRWQERMSYAQIVDRLKIAPATVGARIFRGQRRLRQILYDRLPSAVRAELATGRRR